MAEYEHWIGEVRPLTPDEIKRRRAQGQNIPEEVIHAVNELLIKSDPGRTIRLGQDEIINLAMAKMGDTSVTRHDFFNNHWLDFEPYFEEHGWHVTYVKPDYTEVDREAYFKFTAKA